MESGSSGSLQSSSCGGGGGEEEFDSRCADSSPLSALLRQSAAGFGGSFYGLRHELETPSSSTPLPPLPQAVHHWSPALPVPAGNNDGASPSSSSSHGVPPAAPAQASSSSAAAAAAAGAGRGSRKRTRASRRAPTTVLTTDTSNFRAMVQEFTGVPSPPFAPTATTMSSRFDHLFHSSLRSSPNNPAASSSFPPYLLRTFARQKHQQPSSLFPSSSFASPPPPSQPSIGGSAPLVTAACVSSSSSYQYQHHLLSPDPASAAALLGSSRDHHYLSSFQSPLAVAAGATHTMFDTLSAPTLRPQEQDPAAASSSFLGQRTHQYHGILGTEGTHSHLHPRVVADHGHGRRDQDELSGLVGSGVCGRTTTYDSSSVPGAAALAAPRLLDRNVDSTTSLAGATTTTTTTTAAAAAMRTQGVDAWICTSE